MRKCAEVDDNTRKATFDMFWQRMDWGQKNTYIANMFEVKPKEPGCEVEKKHLVENKAGSTI